MQNNTVLSEVRLYFRFILGNRDNKLRKFGRCKTEDDFFHLYLQLIHIWLCILGSSNTFRNQQTCINCADILYMLKMWIAELGSTALLWGKLTFLFLYPPQFTLDKIPGLLLFHVRNSYTESSISNSFLCLCPQSMTCFPWETWRRRLYPDPFGCS